MKDEYHVGEMNLEGELNRDEFGRPADYGIPGPAPSDMDIAAVAANAISAHPLLEHELHDVRIEADHATVTITGVADSHEAKELAGEKVEEVPGVERVQNELMVPA